MLSKNHNSHCMNDAMRYSEREERMQIIKRLHANGITLELMKIKAKYFIRQRKGSTVLRFMRFETEEEACTYLCYIR